MYGEGISQEGEIFDIGAEEIVQKSGAWFSMENVLDKEEKMQSNL